MKIKWIKEEYRKNKYIINITVIAMIFLAILSGSVVLYKVNARCQELVTDVRIQELQRDSTIEGIPDTYNMVRYIFQAVEKNDLDMWLRGCPIDEMGLGVNTQQIIQDEGEFTIDLTVAPSKEYRTYFPITSAELTNNYRVAYTEFQTSYAELGNLKLKEINYAYPKKQLEADYNLYKQKMCDNWSAEEFCEMAVLLEENGKTYMAGLTLVRYYGFWKVYAFTSDLAGTSEKTPIIEITKEEYEKITEEQFSKKLENEFVKDFDEKEKAERKKISKEIKEAIEKQDALLPANYFIINNAYGDTPRDLVEKFIRNAQKNDILSLMNYGYTKVTTIEDTLDEEKLEQQKNMAEEIKSFYYELMSKGKIKEGTLENIGKSSGKIVEEENPRGMFYIDLLDFFEKDKENGVYTGDVWYDGITFKVDFDLIQTEKGWQIESIGKVKR